MTLQLENPALLRAAAPVGIVVTNPATGETIGQVPNLGQAETREAIRAAAFAAGCAMVLKPAAQTPFSDIALAILAEEAGLPSGLFSVITGAARPIVQAMTHSPMVRKLTFTGSTEVGAQLYAECAPTIKKLGLELGGTFFEAIILTGVKADMEIATEETFGPIAQLFIFETEVNHAANDTGFGVASYFFSRDHARVWRVSEALEYGMVGVNTDLIWTAAVPFGGVKASWLGSEGSRHGLDDYLEIKNICLGGIDANMGA